MTYRLAIKLDYHIYTPERSVYGFHLQFWRVIKCWPVNPRVTAPVTVRRHGGVSSRLLLMTPHAVEPGTLIEPYSKLCAYLAARRAA